MKFNQFIPTTSQEMIALQAQPITDEVIVTALVGMINISRSVGKSLEDIQAEVLADDNLLDLAERRRLRDIVTQAWKTLEA